MGAQRDNLRLRLPPNACRQLIRLFLNGQSLSGEPPAAPPQHRPTAPGVKRMAAAPRSGRTPRAAQSGGSPQHAGALPHGCPLLCRHFARSLGSLWCLPQPSRAVSTMGLKGAELLVS